MAQQVVGDFKNALSDPDIKVSDYYTYSSFVSVL